MRFYISLGLLAVSSTAVWAQSGLTNKTGSGYQFSVIKNIETTDVKDQGKSGTCWSFSTLSFFESEITREKSTEYDLAEMFIVRLAYYEKAVKYVRMHGKANFSQGGAFHDPLNVLEKYGMMPQSAYMGNNYGEDKINHGELEAVLKAYVDAVISNKNGKLSTAWEEGLNGILDAYFGEIPSQFTYNGKTYTPQSFATETGLKASNYVDITSYTHHPFYEPFVLELEDNWADDVCYNLPLDEMMKTLENAVTKGYTAAWGADVSDKGFAFKSGIAVMPAEYDLTKVTKEQLDSLLITPHTQKDVTQEDRQRDFDNWTLTDDHGMQIVGLVKDQLGNKFYIVKNSWGTEYNDCGGYFYASEAYVKARTMNIMIHRDAVPADILKKLKL